MKFFSLLVFCLGFSFNAYTSENIIAEQVRENLEYSCDQYCKAENVKMNFGELKVRIRRGLWNASVKYTQEDYQKGVLVKSTAKVCQSAGEVTTEPIVDDISETLDKCVVKAFSGSLKCEIHKGLSKSKRALVQTSFSDEDSEGNSEAYELVYDNAVKASVSYFPYDNGIYLHLDSVDKKIDVESGSTFDQVSDEHMSIYLKINGTKYTLACRRKL